MINIIQASSPKWSGLKFRIREKIRNFFQARVLKIGFLNSSLNFNFFVTQILKKMSADFSCLFIFFQKDCCFQNNSGRGRVGSEMSTYGCPFCKSYKETIDSFHILMSTYVIRNTDVPISCVNQILIYVGIYLCLLF